MSFGDVRVDRLGPTRAFPAASMVAGLLANALGWDRTAWRDHQALQDRLVLASRIDREGRSLAELQNAGLDAGDLGWTTRGEPEGRSGGAATYSAPHQRAMDYIADGALRAVVGLRAAASGPSLDDLAEALDAPARPLHIGRKHCLPARPLLADGAGRWVDAESAHAALAALPGDGRLRATWPAGEGPEEGPDVARVIDLADLRLWRAGHHAGARRVVEGWVRPAPAA